MPVNRVSFGAKREMGTKMHHTWAAVLDKNVSYIAHLIILGTQTALNFGMQRGPAGS